MSKITKRDQRIVSDVLMQFMFTKTMDDVIKVWNEVFQQFELCYDPFTNTPCTPDDYYKNKIEYEKQIMIEKYGHCDGLE